MLDAFAKFIRHLFFRCDTLGFNLLQDIADIRQGNPLFAKNSLNLHAIT